MKAILVIDMPNDCWECPMHIDGLDDENEEIMVCNAKARESHYGEKPSWCPLKPMPKELSTPYMFRQEMIALGLQNEDGTVSVYSEDYMYGWNDCINEITGGTE